MKRDAIGVAGAEQAAAGVLSHEGQAMKVSYWRDKETGITTFRWKREIGDEETVLLVGPKVVHIEEKVTKEGYCYAELSYVLHGRLFENHAVPLRLHQVEENPNG